MTEQFPFQYSIIQYMHDVVTGEFLNIGLAMYSKHMPFFKVRLLTQCRRITHTFPDADGDVYRHYITHLQTVFDQLAINPEASQPEMFNKRPDQIEAMLIRVLPRDESSIRFSEVHTGLSDNIPDLFDHLYRRLIEHHLQVDEQQRRNDDDVWRIYRQSLAQTQAIIGLRRHVIETKYETIEFPHAWKNGHWNILHPMSLDYASRSSIQRKAREWLGTTYLLKPSSDLGNIYLLLGKPVRPDQDLRRAYKNAKDMIQEEQPGLPMQIIEEEQAESFAKKIAPQIIEHSHDE
jgi:hypothetical protein